MDKETLSNYGWIVIAVLVLAVMIALATPFGNFVRDAVASTTQGLFDVNRNALNAANVPGLTIEDQKIDKPTESTQKLKSFPGYLDRAGSLVESDTMCHTDYIPVENGATYNVVGSIGVSLSPAPGLLFFDESKEFIKFGSNTSGLNHYVTISDPNIKYLVFNHGIYDTQKISCKKVTDSEIKTTEGNITLIGDSITTAYATGPNGGTSSMLSYSFLLADNLNMKYQLLAQSGSTLTGGSFENRAANINSNADIISIMGGVNDFLQQKEIGTISDSTTDTFYGALNSLLTNITTNHPDKTIVYLTPLACKNHDNPAAGGQTLSNYVSAIKQVAENYDNVILIDTFTWSTNNLDASDETLFGDGLHPTVKGHAKVAEFILSEFSRYGIA